MTSPAEVADQPFVYDELPYPGLSFVHTHPGRLALAANLLGLEPPPPENCRVLEMGCGIGANLIPMAEGLPASEFVGVDLSKREIAMGQEAIRETGISNVRLHAMDLSDIDETFGQFDYIISHGVYSWVPPQVREALMRISSERLTPNGIAYISYNTYPGWRSVQGVRETMLYRARGIQDPMERLKAATSFMKLVLRASEEGANHSSSAMDWYEARLKETVDSEDGASAAFMLHDELSEVNDPVYFRDFINHATSHGLQYLCEAHLQGLPNYVSRETLREIAKFATDPIDAEQYIDLIANRMFRMSLLCKEDVAIQRPVRPGPGLLQRLHVFTSASRDAEQDGDRARGIGRYKASSDAVIAFDHPVSVAAFDYLVALKPKLVSFPELFEAARARVGAGDSAEERERDETVLATNLLRAYEHHRELISFWGTSPPIAHGPGERPKATAYSRYQSKTGEALLTNLRHERAAVAPHVRTILPLLDGTRTRGELLRELEAWVADGRLSPVDPGDGEAPPSLDVLMDELLSSLARMAVLTTA